MSYPCSGTPSFLCCECIFSYISMRLKILFPLLVIALVVLVVVLDAQRRRAEAELMNLTVRLEQLQGNNQENQERAQQIVERVRSLIDIPKDVTPTVATIVDVEKLRAQNSFYSNADNCDYLIVTPSRAILFDADRGVIIDVVPVQIEQSAPAATQDAPAAR